MLRFYRPLAPSPPLPAHPALAAVCPHLRVQAIQGGGGIDFADLGPAEGGQDVAVDGAAIVPDGDRGDGADLLAPGKPALDQLGHRPGAAPVVLAAVDLLQELRLHFLGLTLRLLRLAADPAADPPFAAGEGVAAGVDLPLQAAAALPDHPASQPPESVWQKNDKGVQPSKQSKEQIAFELRVCGAPNQPAYEPSTAD
jgi:hypothetical protein